MNKESFIFPKKYKCLNISIAYFFIHLFLEVSCFYILSSYVKSDVYVYIALLYDFFSFVPQAFVGSINDKYPKMNFGFIGIILILISLILFMININCFLLLIPLTIGTCMVHVSGAEATLRTSDGKMFPSSLFVSGGALGIIIGKTLYNCNVSIVSVIVLNVLSMILLLYLSKYKKNENLLLSEFNYSNRKVGSNKIIILAILLVAVRSFMSYGIPMRWNITIFDTFMLYFALTLGKALGGLLVDKIGIRKTIFLSTIISIPFIQFGDSNIYISLIGIMLFSMTMAITLAIIISECQSSPGKGFGYTTIGLFLGTLPMFVLEINSLLSLILFTFFSILSIIILYTISKENEEV